MKFGNMKQYNSQTKEKGELFHKYINTFLKIKQEISGLPTVLMKRKIRYINEYERIESIKLD